MTDFGISRSYRELELADTDGPTSFTWKYAAPEVIQQDLRGLSADIFSLGCVLTEMYTVWREHATFARKSACSLGDLRKMVNLETGKRASYQANIEAICTWLLESWEEDWKARKASPSEPKDARPFVGFQYMHVLCRALSRDPTKRQSAGVLLDQINRLYPPFGGCCSRGTECLESGDC